VQDSVAPEIDTRIAQLRVNVDSLELPGGQE